MFPPKIVGIIVAVATIAAFTGGYHLLAGDAGEEEFQEQTENSYEEFSYNLDAFYGGHNGDGYWIDHIFYPTTVLSEGILILSVENRTVHFRTIFFETGCTGEYKVNLTEENKIFYLSHGYTGFICNGHWPRVIEGEIKGIKPGNYTLKVPIGVPGKDLEVNFKIE